MCADKFCARVLEGGESVAVVRVALDVLRERAFEGNPEGRCVVNPNSRKTGGSYVNIGQFERWARLRQEGSAS